LVLILGGIKSGKSSYALTLALEYQKPRAFLATAEPFDSEMKQRIKRHKESRGDDFELFEEPVNIGSFLPGLNHNVIVVDCLTVWLANLYQRKMDITKEAECLLDNLTGREIFVSNEIGWGVISESALVRDYTERLAKLNQKLAQKAENVYLMVAGIATRIK
jgi:adenosylcobinamide kinase/adenosylcobinamide-phosphate guanylyltransferase